MIPKKVFDHLKRNKIKHEIVKHKPVYTAYDLAATLKESLEKIGKTLLIKVGGKKYIIIIIPAHLKVDFKKLSKIFKIDKIQLASEKEITKVLKVKPGSLLPFGTLHKLETFLDKALLKAEDVLVGAGSFTESLRLKSKDLHKLENATVADLSLVVKKQAKKVAAKIKKAVKKATRKSR